MSGRSRKASDLRTWQYTIDSQSARKIERWDLGKLLFSEQIHLGLSGNWHHSPNHHSPISFPDKTPNYPTGASFPDQTSFPIFCIDRQDSRIQHLILQYQCRKHNIIIWTRWAEITMQKCQQWDGRIDRRKSLLATLLEGGGGGGSVFSILTNMQRENI